MLREDGKRSIDLCTNIISVYFSVSNFTQFHGLIMQNQVREGVNACLSAGRSLLLHLQVTYCSNHPSENWRQSCTTEGVLLHMCSCHNRGSLCSS